MVTQNKDCQFACCIRTIFLIDMSRFALRITCICVLCLFLYGILVNFIQLFDYRLQVRNTAERRINDSENVDDTGCDKCSHSQVTNFWEKNATDCAKIYKEIALSLFQRQTEEDVTNNITKLRHCQWHKQELAAEEFRSELKQCCNSADNFIVTQKNTPVGTELTYEGEPKRKIKITEQIFRLFPKNMSFSSVQYKQCAVVGNGGNLVNSSCGTEIDRADFVFRCNLPPVGGRFTQDVGLKTDLVTANPSIIAKSVLLNLVGKHSRKVVTSRSVAMSTSKTLRLSYPCRSEECQFVATTWTQLQKHLKIHPISVEHCCANCEKKFKHLIALLRHKLIHRAQGSRHICPMENCDLNFTTAFNLEHHIRKDHFKIFEYKCYFPGCQKAFVMKVRGFDLTEGDEA
ncbi:uncharacterized protein LOC125466311 isoform X3 [Stegostoma tigrinum]|uniref:uncharacterized protein LOC125466311 isoform X3 n=1 Tax=Stegostoma tigrinum TaxID=3053191 RepID=UPI00286FD1BF|nr:uncharacterized protein LOC125466311 isoform X3 [Stegostoma tigrinum]